MNAGHEARVVVGVDHTPQGLAALRAAAAEAGWRGMPLHAVRVEMVWPDSDLRSIDLAFDEALGGVPAGLAVTRGLQSPPVAQALAEYADGPDDLLVVGCSGRGFWHAVWSGSIARGCLHRAKCAVLVVPPPPLAREQPRRPWRRRHPRQDLWRRFERETAGSSR